MVVQEEEKDGWFLMLLKVAVVVLIELTGRSGEGIGGANVTHIERKDVGGKLKEKRKTK